MLPGRYPAWHARDVTGSKDWLAWHTAYADEQSPLSRRLRLVQEHIAAWLQERPGEALDVVSVCAGQGHDLLGVLAQQPDAGRVHATLLEYDPRNVKIARAGAHAAGLRNVQVVQADAGQRASYLACVPADLVLLVGVFGNISEADVQGTVEALPELCAADARVIWTRTRRPPDLTAAIRQWSVTSDFAERAFDAPGDALFSVGVHDFVGAPRSLDGTGPLFEFTGAGFGR